MSADTPSQVASAGAPARPAEARKFFEVYKRGQGYYTRWGTVIGGAAIILAGMQFLYNELGAWYRPDVDWTLYVRYGVPILFGVAAGLLLFWVTGSNRRACDFMIATEGEMKKVSWSSRREVIGSTKVVILFMVVMAIVLFVVDIAFMLFFSSIGVLKMPPDAIRNMFRLG